jgi:hypothetical protein
MKQIITMMGQEQTMTMNASEKLYILSLGPVDNNDFKVEFYIDDVNIKTDNPQLRIEGTDFSFITNKKSSALVSKKGLVSDVEAIDVIEFPEDQTIQTVMQQYNPAIFFSRFFLILPANELKVGETWTDTKTEMNDNMGGDMTIFTEYSYTVSEQVNYKGYNCLKIVALVKMSYLGQGVTMGQEIKISGKGHGEATHYFAPKEGKLIGYETNNVSEISMDVIAMEMTIPITNIVSSKAELVK